MTLRTNTEEMSQKKNKKGSKQAYIRGAFISLLIVITGVLLEWFSGGRGVSLPAFPMNLFTGLSFTFIIVFLHTYYRDHSVIRWLSRVPAAVSSIILFTLLTLLMGLTKQNNPEAPEILNLTGISHVRTSFVFLLSGLFLLTTLGLVILRRVTPFTFKNAGFTLNHLGLWLIVFSGSLGAGDLQRLNLYVNEGESVWYGFNNRRQPVKLPFTLKLIDFDIEEYNPKFALIDSETMKLIDAENNMQMIEEDEIAQIGGWTIEVIELFQAAKKDSAGNYIPSTDTLSFPAAMIKASAGDLEKEGWISTGGMMSQPEFIQLDNRVSLAMTVPEPQEYSSLVEVTNSEGETERTTIIVNKPIKVDGWDLYQVSYDEKMGKWSRLSVIEAIKDPWLPVIYTGIFMLIAGALYLFTIGKNR